MTLNCAPGQTRDERGRCGPGVGSGTPRAAMPQVRDLRGFVSFCSAKGVLTTLEAVPAGSLKPVQGEFRQARVDAMDAAALRKPVVVSADGSIIDGLHRWVRLWQEERPVPVLRLRCTTEEALALAHEHSPAYVSNARRSRDPSRTQTLRRWMVAREGAKWRRLKGRVLTLVRSRAVHNVFCPTGEGGGVDPSCSLGSSSIESKRLLHKISIKDSRMYVESYVKESALDAMEWAERLFTEKYAKEPIVEFTVEMPTAEQSYAYLNRMDANKKGAGYGGETLAAVLEELKQRGVTEAVGYIEDGNLASQSMIKRAGGKMLREAKHGAYWTIPLNKPGVHNEDWRHHTDARKVDEFQEWLEEQYKDLGLRGDAAWRKYIDDGYRKGVKRSHDDASRGQQRTADFAAGARDAEVRSAVSRPVARERLEALVSRTYDEADGVADEAARRMSRVLADSLVAGYSADEAASAIASECDVARGRAETVARTELIRAHSEGQLTAMEQMGVSGVGVEVEWLGTDDARMCEDCASMEGAVFSIEDARGMLPRHPNCRCAFVPAIAAVALNRSFFADCERDERGRCLPAHGGVATVSERELRAAQRMARAKFAAATKPPPADEKHAQRKLKELGANKYRRNLVGNSKDRAKRRERLLHEFGDGHVCPCVYCGRKLGEEHATLEQDKLYTTAQGGKYRMENLVPACSSCNNARGDLKFEEIRWPEHGG